MAVPPRYEIRLRESAARASTDAFPDCDVTSDGRVMVIGGEFDQSALHGLLDRIRVLHLELLDPHRTRGRPTAVQEVR